MSMNTGNNYFVTTTDKGLQNLHESCVNELYILGCKRPTDDLGLDEIGELRFLISTLLGAVDSEQYRRLRMKERYNRRVTGL